MAQPAPQSVGPRDADLSGTTVGRFAVRARLGKGGMGEVYRAYDTALKRPVALKRITPRLQSDENYRRRFLHEAQCASGLTDQHIAGLYDVLEANNEVFLVMEYVEGVTLRQQLQRPISIEKLLGIAVQCAAALVAAHERGIVHRDLKPENIMLTPTSQVKILDFGVAKQLPPAEVTATTETVNGGRGLAAGTPAYMAPEALLEKDTDPRADIFSLGVILYEAVSGRHPFLAGSFMATSDRTLHEVPPPLTRLNPKVPAELERIVAKMLAKNPDERYATAADLLVDLRAVQRTVTYPTPLPARDDSTSGARGWITRNKGKIFVAALGLLLVISIGLLSQVRQRFHWFDKAIAGPKNVAVLPFQAIGGAPENQAFSDGITEALTAKLTQLTATHQLQVAPGREVRARRISGPEEARKELGASLILEGTVYRSGNTVRVNYALVDTSTRRQIRAGTITADASDPFAVQDRVADGVVRMLELELNPQERRALQVHGTQVAVAYDFYLQGSGYLQNYDRPENIENAINVFERALSLDPNYALAHAGIGEAYWKAFESRKETQWIDPARKACERALALNDKLAEAHICLGTLHNGIGQYEAAVADFQKALETEPTSDAAYRGLAEAYERLGNLTDAERTYREAIELRPHYWAGYHWLGKFYFHRARYPEAAEMFKQVVALVPDSFLGYSSLGALLHLMGRTDEAIADFQKSLAIKPTYFAYSNLGTLLFFQGRYGEAVLMFEKAAALAPNDYEVQRNLADAYRWAPGLAQKAPPAYRRAIELAQNQLRVNPRDSTAYSILAICWVKLGEKNKALEAITTARRESPGDVAILSNAVQVYHLVGLRQRALETLAAAVRGGYSLAEIRAEPELAGLRSDPRYPKIVSDAASSGISSPGKQN